MIARSAAFRLWACFAVAALVLGCEVEEPAPAKPAGPRLVRVHGKVTVDGKPLAGASVVFLPAFSDAGTHSAGETDADGVYELSTLSHPGAGVGDYRVSISYMVTRTGRLVSMADRDAIVKSPDLNEGEELVPPRYYDFSKTELRATVRGNDPPIDFELEGPLRTSSFKQTPPAIKPDSKKPATVGKKESTSSFGSDHQ